MGWCSVSVCVWCVAMAWRVSLFFFCFVWGREIERRQVLCESGGCVGDVLSVSVTFAPTLPSRRVAFYTNSQAFVNTYAS